MFENISIPTVLISYVALLFSLCVHEMSHAGAAYLLGDDTAQQQGRLTLNPIAHADLIGTVIFPIVGLLFGGFFIGWAKPVPFSPWRLTRKLQMKISAALISIAGPASNVVLAFLAVAITSFGIRLFEGNLDHRAGYFIAAFRGPETLIRMGASPLQVMFLGLGGALVQMNVLLAAFNMLPVGPLDGAGVLGGFLPDHMQHRYNQLRYHPYTWIALMVLMMSGIGGFLLRPISALAYTVLLPIAQFILGV